MSPSQDTSNPFRFRRYGNFVSRRDVLRSLRITTYRAWVRQLNYFREKGGHEELLQRIEAEKKKVNITSDLAEGLVRAVVGEVEIEFY